MALTWQTCICLLRQELRQASVLADACGCMPSCDSFPPPPGRKTCPWETFLGFIPLDRAGTGQRHIPPHCQLALSSSSLTAVCCFLLTGTQQKGQFDSLTGRGPASQTFPSAPVSGQMLFSPLCLQSHHFHSRPRRAGQFYDDIKNIFFLQEA